MKPAPASAISPRALIFDLDNCLAPATEIGEELVSPAFDAMRRANQGVVPEDSLKQAFADVWRHPLDWVAARYGFSDAMLDAGWQVFKAMKVSRPMSGYDDLAVLSELPGIHFLVTSGFRRLQESKVTALGLRPLFQAIYIDAIDEPGRLGKKRIFEGILERHALRPGEVLVIGDNAESEIDAGNRLGIRTVQTLRPGVPQTDTATHHVRDLIELKKLIGGMTS